MLSLVLLLPIGVEAINWGDLLAGTYDFSNQTSRARDMQRVADLTQLKVAVEMYAIDHGGYPNSSGCVDTALVRVLQPYLSTLLEDPQNLWTTTVVNGGCGSPLRSGNYAYLPLNRNSVNDLAEGYLLVAQLEYQWRTGDFGVYFNTTPWTPTITGSNATAAFNLADAAKCTAMTIACNGTNVNRYYMVGGDY